MPELLETIGSWAVRGTTPADLAAGERELARLARWHEKAQARDAFGARQAESAGAALAKCTRPSTASPPRMSSGLGPAPDGPGPLLAALGELAALGTADDQQALADLRTRLHAARLRVLVAGEAKRGKSTLVNALLGRPVLPAGVIPLTALPTTVHYGQDEGGPRRFRGRPRRTLPAGRARGPGYRTP